MVDALVLPAFIAASLVIITSPGADTMLLLRYAIRDGRRAGFQALIGILLGLTLVSVLLISGVGIAVASIEGALQILAWVGALVLLALGVTATIAGTRILRRPAMASEAPDLPPPTIKRSAALRTAFVTNATNPKVLVFYLAFFPQFLGESSSSALQLTLLAIVFLLVSVAWLVPLVYAAHAMRQFFAAPRVAMSLEFFTAAVFILLAGLLLLSGPIGGGATLSGSLSPSQ